MRWLGSITNSTDRNLSKLPPRDSGGQGSLTCCSQSMGLQRVGHDLATEQQQQEQQNALIMDE